MSGDIDTDELRDLLRQAADRIGHDCDLRVPCLTCRIDAALSASPAGEREPGEGGYCCEHERINERQAVIDAVNLYGDETLHSALDAIDWPDGWSEAAGERDTTEAGEGWEPTHPYLNVERCPQTLGDAMRLIGRYTESEGGDSPETRQARTDLFDAYLTWCDLDRPETEAPKLTPEQTARFEAAAARALAARPAPVTGKGPDDLEPAHERIARGAGPGYPPRPAGQGGEPTSGTDDFGRVLIPADDDRRRQLGEAVGLTPEEQSALDAFAFREAEKRQRGVLTTAEAEGGEPTRADEEHAPFSDDGILYCGYDGVGGCGEAWPCSFERLRADYERSQFLLRIAAGQLNRRPAPAAPEPDNKP